MPCIIMMNTFSSSLLKVPRLYKFMRLAVAVQGEVARRVVQATLEFRAGRQGLGTWPKYRGVSM